MQSPPPAAAFSIPIASSRIKYMSHLVDPIDKKTKQWQKTSLLNSVPIPLLDQNHPQDCRVSRGQHQHWWGGSLLFNNKKSATKILFSSKLIELIEQKTISKVNISQLGLGKLRSRITIIPQDPVVLLDLDLYFRFCCSLSLLTSWLGLIF